MTSSLKRRGFTKIYMIINSVFVFAHCSMLFLLPDCDMETRYISIGLIANYCGVIRKKDNDKLLDFEATFTPRYQTNSI